MTNDEVAEFFAGRIPQTWFTGPVQLESDEDEIVCVGTLPPGRTPREFREATRAERVAIAQEAESRFGTPRCRGEWSTRGRPHLFTTLTIPTMTRLRLASVVSSTRWWTPASPAAGARRCRGASGSSGAIRLNGSRISADALVGVERIRSEGPTFL